MSNPESTNEPRFNPLQKLGAGVGVASTVGYGLYNPEGLSNVASWAASSVNDILHAGGEIANDAIGEGLSMLGANIPMAAVAAPFVAPMIAGAYLSKRAADIAGIENKWIKAGASVVGAGVGGLFVASAAAPYLTGAAIATALYTPAKFLFKGAGKITSSVYGGVAGAVGGAVKGAAIGGVSGAKTNWSNGSIIPDVGFQRRTSS